MAKKYLIVSDAWHPQVNGVVRTYEYLRDVAMGHEVRVIGPGDFNFTVPMPGYAEIRLVLAPYGRLSRTIEEYDPDFIHIAAEGPLGWACRKYCVKRMLSFSTSYHTHFPDYVAKRVPWVLGFLRGAVREIAKRVVKRFHAPSRVMLVATQSLEDELKEWGFKTPMSRLTRGARLDLYYPGPPTLFEDMKRPVALYVGRVAVEKSIEDFLSMEWHGSKVVVGEGPIMTELVRKYPDVVFAGRKTGEELAAHYRSADVFVFPSRTDTFGIVLVEALASGLPVAGYKVTGPRDIVTEDFLGALEDNDLAAAARKALVAGTAAQRAEFVKKAYTWKQAAEQFIEALAQTDQHP
ncbi:MAG TPA: glycosyltransferase family 1 protein [Alphaproteobacteria bacterium]|nr:glycosyltransferase family 1 protein [Alphaproteobacteria bacterium]